MTPWALALGLALLACPLPAALSRDEVAAVMDTAQASLLIRLPRFDDAVLQLHAGRALSRGAKVRLILNRREKASRLAAAGLRAAGMQLRWTSKKGLRFVAADAARVVLGNFDGQAASLDAPDTGAAGIGDPELAVAFAARFEKEWAGLREALPGATELKDELEALPDPRETEPRVQTKRRRN